MSYGTRDQGCCCLEGPLGWGVKCKGFGWFNVPFDIAQLRGAGIMAMEIDNVVTKRVGVAEDG